MGIDKHFENLDSTRAGYDNVLDFFRFGLPGDIGDILKHSASSDRQSAPKAISMRYSHLALLEPSQRLGKIFSNLSSPGVENLKNHIIQNRLRFTPGEYFSLDFMVRMSLPSDKGLELPVDSSNYPAMGICNQAERYFLYPFVNPEFFNNRDARLTLIMNGDEVIALEKSGKGFGVNQSTLTLVPTNLNGFEAVAGSLLHTNYLSPPTPTTHPNIFIAKPEQCLFAFKRETSLSYDPWMRKDVCSKELKDNKNPGLYKYLPALEHMHIDGIKEMAQQRFISLASTSQE